MLVSTAFLRWTRNGQGESLVGLDLADQLRRGPLRPEWGPAAGNAIYLTVGAGALLLSLCPFGGVRVRMLRVVVCAVVAVSLLALVVLGHFPTGRWGTAPLVALIASSGGVLANVTAVPKRLSGLDRQLDVADDEAIPR